MIVSGASPFLYIDLGRNEPGMTLQQQHREGSYLDWRDCMKDGKPVKSPIDIDALPPGKYRLV